MTTVNILGLPFVNCTATSVLFVTIAVISSIFIYIQLKTYGRWERYGVRHANVGLVMELAAMAQAALQHGDTVGVSREQLFLVTKDLDLLKQILVKDFNVFANRQERLLTRSPIRKAVFFLRDSMWKRVRQLISPSFSTRKLKLVSVHMHEAAEKMALAAQELARSGKRLKVKHLAGQYTTSIIARTAFGLQTDCIGEDEDDQFTRCAKNMFVRRGKIGRYILIFCAMFRFLYKFFFWMRIPFFEPVNQETSKYLISVLTDAVRIREQAETEGHENIYNDFLQSLVSVKVATSGQIPADSAISDINQSPDTSTETRRSISMEEIMGQSIFVILAGFETTATSIQFCLYLLAKNPEVQDLVYSEIQTVVQSKCPSHQELSRLVYTEQVINETLRLYPPVANISRQATEPRTYGDMTIPADAAVLVPIREIHRDPRNFPDPERFDPERFCPAQKALRHPLSFMPFGWGPRLCIGQRLAYLEIKTCLVYFLRKVKVEFNKETVPPRGEEITVPLKTIPVPSTPIELCVTLRDE